MRTLSDSFRPLHLLHILSFHLLYLPALPAAFPLRSWGPLDNKNSSKGYEPKEHIITEAYVEFTQESVTEQQFPEDFDYDEITIGQTLLDACRRRADHSEGEGLSSYLSSSVNES